MNRHSVHFSSARQDWETPWPLFLGLKEEYGPFDLDVCATPENTKCERFYTTQENGLLQSWNGNCWMNPPYGREIGRWIKKATEEVRTNAHQIVCLLPARTDTSWWHDYVERHAAAIRFIRGRIKFEGARFYAPFPSVIVIFNTGYREHEYHDRCFMERYRHTAEDFYL